MMFLLTTQEHILISTAAKAVAISAIMPEIVFQYLHGQQETIRNIDIRQELDRKMKAITPQNCEILFQQLQNDQIFTTSFKLGEKTIYHIMIGPVKTLRIH